MSQLTYRAEYASGRLACKGCNRLIEERSLRLAIMVKSQSFDGMLPKWFHMRCFFDHTQANNVDEIADFQNLRWADQEDIRAKIGGSLNGPLPALTNTEGTHVNVTDYTVEYAKSNRTKCKVCEETIKKGEIRISKKEYERETARKRWHHVDCFGRARSELELVVDASDLPGFSTLEPEDQTTLKSKIPALDTSASNDAPSAPKKQKLDNDDNLMKTMKRQNDEFYKNRDELQNIPKKDLITLLEHNKQYVPEGEERILDGLADAMTFGTVSRCSECSGQMVFRSGVGYQCIGFIADWTKCKSVIAKPQRTNFEVPKYLKSAYPFLQSYVAKTAVRAFKEAVLPTTKQPTAVASSRSLPLCGLNLYIHETYRDIKEVAEGFGGSLKDTLDSSVIAVISLPDIANRLKLKVMRKAKEANIPVVSEDFLTCGALSATSTREDVIKILRVKTCSLWGADNIESKMPGADIVDGIVQNPVSPSNSASTKSIFRPVTVKDGLVVDPIVAKGKLAQVYKNQNDVYSVVLGFADLQQNASYYKLQVFTRRDWDLGDWRSTYEIRHRQLYLFRSWGRIGTDIGGSETTSFGSRHDDCLMEFERLFEEKTGNMWKARHKFIQVPSKMIMMDVVHPSAVIDARAKLALPVQELMTLIFDIKAMEATMMEFELDLQIMPLSKLSQVQFAHAHALLSELQRLRIDESNRNLVIDRSNRFYTLVPHHFGKDDRPVLDRDEMINKKIQMLNCLMDMKIAYNLHEAASDGLARPIDDHYNKLNTSISVLDKASDEFKAIVRYVSNTHADTHSNYELVVQEVFKVERDGECERYEAFKKLPNRMLLWHGSRLTNFAAILSQGLRLPPPEAPSTGYKFGKGIYFADMVSKAAKYCMTSSQNPTGLLLLCEVTLGTMHELKLAQNIVKPPAGFYSVKGVGMTQPDPGDTGVTPTGAVIPFGKGKTTANEGASDSLLYNEFVVYDEGQVNIQYLVKMHFEYGE